MAITVKKKDKTGWGNSTVSQGKSCSLRWGSWEGLSEKVAVCGGLSQVGLLVEGMFADRAAQAEWKHQGLEIKLYLVCLWREHLPGMTGLIMPAGSGKGTVWEGEGARTGKWVEVMLKAGTYVFNEIVSHRRVCIHL